MRLRVTDLMIDAAVKGALGKEHPNVRRKKPKRPKKGWPKTCLPHTAPRCRTCTTVTHRTEHFTTGNTCNPSSYESAVRAELLAQLRSTLNAPDPTEELIETAA